MQGLRGGACRGLRGGTSRRGMQGAEGRGTPLPVTASGPGGGALVILV